MGSSKLKRAIGAVKDQTSVGLAKVNGRSASLSELDVAIVKATRHEEYPAEEKYIREILSLTSYSRNYINACVNTLSRRLNKTKCWTVALKTLILIQRLLAEGDKAYEQEIFFATRRGTRLLNMSDFRDVSRSNSWDYSAFVRTYALYLDERLDFRMQTRHGKRGVYCVGGGDAVEDEKDKPEADLSTAIVVRSQPIAEMKTEKIFTRVQHLQQLLDRFLACRPTVTTTTSRATSFRRFLRADPRNLQLSASSSSGGLSGLPGGLSGGVGPPPMMLQLGSGEEGSHHNHMGGGGGGPLGFHNRMFPLGLSLDQGGKGQGFLKPDGSGKRFQDDVVDNRCSSMKPVKFFCLCFPWAMTQPAPPMPHQQSSIRPRVRARRGQATDPHSIAERLRRERIAERIRALQELVPTVNKVSILFFLSRLILFLHKLLVNYGVLSMSRLGGAGAVAPLVTEMPLSSSTEDETQAVWENGQTMGQSVKWLS
ncbi:hypothetical protein Bca52824_079756 [Brassica carinata]|uniref:ENTH domain-containing protein n=1 Tax=Brassica carinata TaxID=52824 RepID=A0A8X7TZL2_BRACI|nr:hypothetical protein Bca52824_079756 [Brassica carinata]